MIKKEIINAGLTTFYPVIVLFDEDAGQEVIMDRDDYSDLLMKEGMNDREIMNFAGVI
jgi:hypothetical protein